MEGSGNESDDASVHNEAINTQQQPNIQPQIITTVSNNNAKFPYLKKDDMKRTGRDHDGRVIILPPTIAEEHIAVQRESKARTTLLQSIPDDHGLHKGYDRMQKILSQLNQLKTKPEDEDINLKFLRALPSSWSQVTLTLKTKGGLELLSFDDVYYKLKTLEVDVQGYTTFSSSQSAGQSHSAFVSATSASKKMSYGDSLNYSSTTIYSVPSNSKTRNVIKDVLQSFVADTELEQQLAYEDFKQIEKLDLEEMVLKWKMAMLFVRVHKFEQKGGRKIDFDKKESARFNKKKVRCYKYHDSESVGVIAAKEFGMIAGCDSENAIEKGTAKIYNLIIEVDTQEASTAGDAGELALMRVTSEKVLQGNQLTLEDKIRVLSIELENTSNLLKHSKRINADVETAKKDLQKKLDNHLVKTKKWRNSSKNLFRLIDSSMSVRTKVGLGFHNCISDKSLEVNTNKFASSDSSVQSSEPKPNDSTSCASTFSVSTSENEAEIESNVGTLIQEPIIVQDLPSFSCNSSDKNENTSRTSFNKNGSFNKKVGHFRKHVSSVSKLCFVFGSGTHLIKDCDFYEKKMPNKTVGIRVCPARSRNEENPFLNAKVEGIFDSGCSRSMTGNKERLDDFQAFQGGKVMFGGGEGRITGKGTIRTPTLDFENVYYVKELQQFNLFSISQICDKKNQVLFTDTECLVLSTDFKLPDESMVVLRVPKKHNLYTINLNNLCPRGNLACLVAHASVDESVKWHRRMGHVNYKNMNRLVKGNLVRGLPPKLFKNDHTCVACCKGKQHKASYKAINAISSISEPLQLLHMDLFGPTLIRSIDHKYYCLVITDDYRRFCWIFFLEHKDATYPILRDFINLVENQLNKKTKAVITACYVLNRVLVTSPHNKTPYALLTGKIPSADEGYIVGYSASNKAYRGLGHEWYFDLDYLTDTLGYKHVQANQSAGTQGATTNPVCTQDADSDSDSNEQVIIVLSYLSHSIQGTEPKDTSGDAVDGSPLNSADEIFQKELARLQGQEHKATSNAESLGLGFANDAEELQKNASAKIDPPGSIPVPTGYIPVPTGATMVSTDDVSVHASSSTDSFFDDEPTTRFPCPSDLVNHDPSPGIFSFSSYDDESGDALNNVASNVEVSPVATRRINTIHPQSLIIGDPTSAVQMRSKALEDPSWVDAMQEEMKQFKFQNVWVLVDLPEGKYVLGLSGYSITREIPGGLLSETRLDLWMLRVRFFMEELMRRYMSLNLGVLWILNIPRRSTRRGIIDKTFFLKKNNRDIILVQVYVDDLIFRSIKKAWCDEFEALMKGEFQISAMGELTFFLVIACLRNQVTPTTSNLEAVKKIFKYLKGQPKKLISWQCKKQTIVATSSTEAEYVVAANCCGQVLWIQNQLLDYGSPKLGPPAIQATIDKTPYTITEDLVRSQLQLADDGGIDDLPIAKIYSGMDNLEYVTEGKLTFFKNNPIAVALIFLSDGGRFNSSSYIFKGMVSNIGNAKKFLIYPRFLQAILGIETRIKRQYKVLTFSSKLFVNMRLNFEGHPMPLLPAMLLQAPTCKDEPLGDSFHMSSPRSTQALPAGQPSGGAEDPITLYALSFVVSSLMKKVNYLETELKDHKKVFKDVVGKLVKKVKSLEVKLRTKKRKMVVSDSDQEEGKKQDVDLDALHALANAAMTVDSNIPPGGASNTPATSISVPAAVPTGASTVATCALSVPTGSPSVPVDVPPSITPAGLSNKGKAPMMDEYILVKKRTFKQIEEDRLELQRRRQQEVLDLAMYYTEADWIHIMAQVEANASLFKTLLGDNVTEDNFPARMAALIKRKKQALSCAVYSTRWSMARVKSFTDAKLKEEFEKIQKAISNTHIQAFSQTLKRTGPVLEEPSSKRQKSNEAPILFALEVPQSLDLVKLYGLVVQYYENHPVAGAGLILWGDLQIKSWRLYTLSNVHILETVSGEVLSMFADVSYPLSIKFMEKMLRHNLEIDKDVVGNDITTAEQLIQVFNSPMLYLLRVEMVTNSPWIMPILGTKELASPEQTALDSSILLTFVIQCCWFEFKYADAAFSRDIPLTMYVVSTGRVIVPTGRYVVPAGIGAIDGLDRTERGYQGWCFGTCHTLYSSFSFNLILYALEFVFRAYFDLLFRPQFSLHYELEQGYNENYTSYPNDSSSLPQQYLCCARCGGPYETCHCDQLIFDEPYYKHCGGPHMNFQYQPMNQDSYNSNSLGFDQPQPPQSPIIHQPPQELSIQEMEDLKQQYLDELKHLSNLEYRDEIKIAELTENFNGMSIEIQKKEKLLQQEQ
uniref:Ribonuclease H-like domain-containing protein n=1 Tax=Tanacetum cinerariifolium TaxID=118510 RepID=A0A6L2NLJ4_TANCI|nr:ribonuclease H-like domain-containing protein [Tanacetum cinerariifolium]